MKVIIRKPISQDLEALVALGIEFAEKSKEYHNIAVDKTKVRKLVERILSGADSTMVSLVCEVDGKVGGFIFGVIVQPLFSNDYILQEMAMYSLGKGGMDLIKAFENEAVSRKISKICLGSKPAFCDLGKIYKRRGYKLLEEHYLKTED
jgi:hypothetical protein